MSLQRAEGAAVALLRSSAAWRRSAALATATNRAGAWRFQSRGLSSTRSNRSHNGSARRSRGSTDDGDDAAPKRKKAGNLPDDASVAVLGGGLTGLTTAYYLAKWLPSTTKITLLEGSDRLGGWIRTDRVPVKVGGVEGVVNFERGPRSLSSLNKSTWRFDDLVLWDLVRLQLLACVAGWNDWHWHNG